MTSTPTAHTLRHCHDALVNRTQTVLPSLPSVAAGPELPERALNYLYYGSGHLHQINLGLRDDAAPVRKAATNSSATWNAILDRTGGIIVFSFCGNKAVTCIWDISPYALQTT